MAELNIVLHEPEIPANTGNIGRTCVATGTKLHLIEPLGFEISDRYLKRAGLDYWHLMTYRVHESWEAFVKSYPNARMHFATTKAPRDYCAVAYAPDDFLVFGRETRGLPYASIFCTGNLRTAAEYFYVFASRRDAIAGVTCLRYLIVIGAFAVGVLGGANLARLWDVRSIWVCCGMLIALMPLMIRAEKD